jgi:ADP-ribosylglycohydrolase
VEIEKTMKYLFIQKKVVSLHQGSVPEAIIAFLEGNSFEEAIRLAISLGGDSDTIGAMAGAIAACCYEIPQFISDKCNAILTEDLREIQNEFEKLTETRNEKASQAS